MKAEDFKSALRSYRWMEREIQNLWYRIQEKDHDLTGLARKGVEMSAEQEKSALPMPRGHSSKSLVDRICELDELKQRFTGLVNLKTSLDNVLSRMTREEKALVMAYFCDGVGADELAKRFGYSNRKGVHRRLNASIKQSCR